MKQLINKTIKQIFLERVSADPEKNAVTAIDGCVTWRELDRYSDAMAVRLYNQGARRGMHLGIWSANSLQWIVAFIAAQKLGMVTVPINAGFLKHELAYAVNYAEVSILCTGYKYKDNCCAQILDELKSEEEIPGYVRFIDIGDDKQLSMESFSEEECSQEAVANALKESEGVTPENTALILFTSGTTSKPKGVMLSSYNMVNSSLETGWHMQWNKEDKMLIAVPFFHCFGLTSSLFASMLAGFELVLLPYAASSEILAAIPKYSITLLNGVPSMFLAMIHNPSFGKYDLTSLKKGIIAGSSCSAEDYMSIRNAIPSLKLHSSYGQTETSPCVSIGDIADTDEENANTAGRIIENISVKVTDAKTGEDLPCGCEGEIRVKGYNVTKGYYNLPRETAEAISPDGWLHTGDIGKIDEKGFLYVTGRIKEMIIRCGENISPKEIECAIREIPGVEEVKVIGLPKPVIQEMIVACVVAAQEMALTEQMIKERLLKRLAKYKVPEHVLFFDELPMNQSGKYLLTAIKETAEKRLAAQ